MNLDDESYLSAYLDDELDPADRLAAEWSIESSPPLGDQLRSLALARDAVAGLDRPEIPRDLAPALGARIAASRRTTRIRSIGRPVRIAFAFSSFSAVAASLIFALILLNHLLHDPIDQPKIVVQSDQVPAPRPDTLDPSPSPSPTQTFAHRSTEVAVEPTPLQPGPAIVSRTPVEPRPLDEAKELGDRQRIARMLEGPNVRRIVVVTDMIDMIDAANRIKDLIHQDARKTPEFGRITICQEIVVDPEHAEAAEIFAVPMDERGRQSFVNKLGRQFSNVIEEGELRPDLITQLSEVGQVAIFRGTEAAPLGDPPVDLRPFVANRANDPDDPIGPGLGSNDPARPETADSSLPKNGSSLASRGNETRPDFVGPPDPRRVPPLKPSDPVTVLVWVTRPGRR